jgi:glycosyltransferase involved in cell wall biosynthesis
MACVRVHLFTYRRPALLPRAVASLRAQTFTDWVCELHNDAPEDPFPAELVRQTADSRIMLRSHDKNLGAVASFNLAFSPAAEPFVSLLEDDNWWEPTLLARLLAELDSRPECGVAWANMRLWREEPDGNWTDTNETIWPVINRPALTIAWPQPLQIDTPLHSHGAMLMRSTVSQYLGVPSTTPLDIIEPFRERSFHYPLVFIPEPLANFALTRESARPSHAGDWLESQTLQAASFLKNECLDAAAIAHLWRARREASPPATAVLFFAGLLEPKKGFLRGATMRDWLRFLCGLIRHPWLAARALTARRRKTERWKDLDGATEEAGRRAAAPADVPAGRLASRRDLPSALNVPR